MDDLGLLVVVLELRRVGGDRAPLILPMRGFDEDGGEEEDRALPNNDEDVLLCGPCPCEEVVVGGKRTEEEEAPPNKVAPLLVPEVVPPKRLTSGRAIRSIGAPSLSKSISNMFAVSQSTTTFSGLRAGGGRGPLSSIGTRSGTSSSSCRFKLSGGPRPPTPSAVWEDEEGGPRPPTPSVAWEDEEGGPRPPTPSAVWEDEEDHGPRTPSAAGEDEEDHPMWEEGGVGGRGGPPNVLRERPTPSFFHQCVARAVLVKNFGEEASSPADAGPRDAGRFWPVRGPVEEDPPDHDISPP